MQHCVLKMLGFGVHGSLYIGKPSKNYRYTYIQISTHSVNKRCLAMDHFYGSHAVDMPTCLLKISDVGICWDGNLHPKKCMSCTKATDFRTSATNQASVNPHFSRYINDGPCSQEAKMEPQNDQEFHMPIIRKKNMFLSNLHLVGPRLKSLKPI